VIRVLQLLEVHARLHRHSAVRQHLPLYVGEFGFRGITSGSSQTSGCHRRASLRNAAFTSLSAESTFIVLDNSSAPVTHPADASRGTPSSSCGVGAAGALWKRLCTASSGARSLRRQPGVSRVRPRGGDMSIRPQTETTAGSLHE
jgi:hypothetical protein